MELSTFEVFVQCLGKAIDTYSKNMINFDLQGISMQMRENQT